MVVMVFLKGYIPNLKRCCVNPETELRPIDLRNPAKAGNDLMQQEPRLPKNLDIQYN